MKKYGWKRAIAGIPAQTAGEYIEGLIEQKEGYIRPFDIVEAARPANSVLHNAFEWNDKAAAESYRIEQAKYLLRGLVVIEPQGDKEPIIVRAYVSVEDEEENPVYTTIYRAVNNERDWQYVVGRALAELQAWKEKYKTLKQFESVFSAIDSLKI
jgi:hypothetical protein